MSSSINNIIPLTSPFDKNPRKVISIPSNIVDWVLVELRSTVDGSAIVSKSALLHNDGRIVADDGSTNSIRITVDPGNYYIVVRHRNHLSVVSANTITLTAN